MYDTPGNQEPGQGYVHMNFLIWGRILSTKGKSMKLKPVLYRVKPIGTRHLPGSPRVSYCKPPLTQQLPKPNTMYYMHTFGSTKCMHVVHSVGFRKLLVLGWLTLHDVSDGLSSVESEYNVRHIHSDKMPHAKKEFAKREVISMKLVVQYIVYYSGWELVCK